MKIIVYSISKDENDKVRWPGEDAICPVCRSKFGGGKMIRVDAAGNLSAAGKIIHKKCLKDL